MRKTAICWIFGIGYLMFFSLAADPASSAGANEAAADWPQYRRDAARTCWAPGTASDQDQLQFLWGRDISQDNRDHLSFMAQPIATSNSVFLGTLKGKMRAFNSRDGADLWMIQGDGPVTATAAYLDERVYFATQFGVVHAVDAASGQEVWRHDAGPPGFIAAPLVAENSLYMLRSDGSMFAFDPADGKIKWTFSAGIEATDTPAYGGGLVFFMGQDNIAYAVNAADGKQAWKTGPLPGSPRAMHAYSPVFHNGKVVFVTVPEKLFWDKSQWDKETENPDFKMLLSALGLPLIQKELVAQSGQVLAWSPEQLEKEQKLYSEFLKSRPEFQHIHVLNAADGSATGIIPGIFPVMFKGRVGPQPPAVTPDGMCFQTVPTLPGWGIGTPCVYGRWPLATGLLTRRYPVGTMGTRPGDEFEPFCCVGRLVFDKRRGNIQPGSAFDMDSGKNVRVATDCRVDGQIMEPGDLNSMRATPSVAHGKVFDNNCDWLVCMEIIPRPQ